MSWLTSQSQNAPCVGTSWSERVAKQCLQTPKFASTLSSCWLYVYASRVYLTPAVDIDLISQWQREGSNDNCKPASNPTLLSMACRSARVFPQRGTFRSPRWPLSLCVACCACVTGYADGGLSQCHCLAYGVNKCHRGRRSDRQPDPSCMEFVETQTRDQATFLHLLRLVCAIHVSILEHIPDLRRCFTSLSASSGSLVACNAGIGYGRGRESVCVVEGFSVE